MHNLNVKKIKFIFDQSIKNLVWLDLLLSMAIKVVFLSSDIVNSQECFSF